MKRALVLVVLVPVVAAFAAPEYWEAVMRLAVAAVGAVLAYGLTRRTWESGVMPAVLTPRRRDEEDRKWPSGAQRFRGELDLAVRPAQDPRIDLGRALRRSCRRIAAERLHARHALDLERADQREAVRRVVGDELHDFLDGGPLRDHGRLADALEAL